MSIIPQTKCRRCGTSYSSLLSRCPNCGTKKVSQSGRTPSPTPSTIQGTASYEKSVTNTRWQLIFGLILVIAVIAAVIVMVSTGIDGTTDTKIVKSTPKPEETHDVQPVVESAPTPTPTPQPTIEKIAICFYQKELEEFTTSLSNEEELTFSAVIYPLEVSGKVNWRLENVYEDDAEEHLKLVVNDDGTCTVKGTSVGHVYVIAELYGVEARVKAYVVN